MCQNIHKRYRLVRRPVIISKEFISVRQLYNVTHIIVILLVSTDKAHFTLRISLLGLRFNCRWRFFISLSSRHNNTNLSTKVFSLDPLKSLYYLSAGSLTGVDKLF